MLPEANITSLLFHRNSSDLAIGSESLYRLSNAVLNQCNHPSFSARVSISVVRDRVWMSCFMSSDGSSNSWGGALAP